MAVSKIEKLSLADLSGGLNDRDAASALAQNEAARLENYFTDNKGLLTKRPGEEIIQYAPIDPTPYVPDANTLIHYTFDGASITSGEPNTGTLGATYDLVHNTGDPTLNGTPSAKALFPIGAGLGRQGISADNSGAHDGSNLSAAFIGSLPFDDLGFLTIRGWANIPPSFSGAPVNVIRAGASAFPAYSNSGAVLLGTVQNSPDVFAYAGGVNNGFTIHRDYDATIGADSSAPYVKFTLRTKGIPGTVTVLQSKPLQTGVMLEFKGTYNSAAGIAELYVNGALHAQATVVGAGVVDDSLAYLLVALGSDSQGDGSYSNVIYKSCAGVVLDEWEISDVVRPGFNFKLPRGMGFEFSKSDGTRQAVVSAEESLWQTLGDGAWTRMLFYDDTAPDFSLTAFWDAIFRNDILYLANGVDSPLAWDGDTLTNWMAPVAPPTVTLSATIGTITAGTHRVAYSYLYGSYETGLSPYAEVPNPGGEQLNVSDIQPRHSNATGVRIYMTKTGDTTWYLARQIAHTPGATMAIDGPYTAGTPSYDTDSGALGPADGTLGGAGFPLASSQVVTNLSPNPKYLLAEHDRAFVCGMEDERYTLRWSELGAFDVFNVFAFANATSNQGNLIGLASYYGEVHCSKDGRATLILRGSNPQNWRVLETLHPNVGSIDHWSYVHRYPVNSDKYVLCFKGRDGFYKYAGQQIECISDKIKGTTERLSSNNATRDEWSVTTTAQWQAQAAMGGSATANIQAARYETDGLREFGGTAKIVDQLDYLGLWSSAAALVSGNVIATCKGVNEGEFYFATDAANTLYWTPDNYQTVIAIATPLDAAERIIEIVRQGTANTYFLFADTAHADAANLSSAGGNLWAVVDPTGSGGIGPVYTQLNTTALYYNLDVPIRMQAGQVGPNYWIGQGFSSFAPRNVFINHPQNVDLPVNWSGPGLTFLVRGFTNATVSGAATGNPYNQSGTVSTTLKQPVTPGFYSYVAGPVGAGTMNSLLAIYSRREFPFWRGGTFRPQAYWDATNSQLAFLATTADNADGQSFSYLRTWDSANGVRDRYTATNVSAMTSDGTSLFFWTVADGGGGSTGFDGRIRQSALTSPGTVASGAVQDNVLALRLSFNAQDATVYLGAFKNFNTPTQEFWTYTASLRRIPFATSVPVSIQALTANGDSGALFAEIALQTTTPYRWYAAVSRLSAANPQPFYVIQPDATATPTVFKSDAYISPTGGAAVTGIRSNLLFVAASGVSGGNLWSDRLYWWAPAVAASDSRFIQLGVPGDWTVIGILVSESHNFGTISAFDNLESAFSNNGNVNGLMYEVRNAADAVALTTAAYQQQAPNSKILGFAPALPYFQWRLTFTWTYDSTTGALVTSSPSTEFVNIGFFIGQANLPRVIGFHWEGRTFWACAEDGSPTNNVVLVYQKNGGWMKIYGWPVKSMFRFRNQMVGLQDYAFVRLMTGNTDCGALIVGKARTGAIMGFLDKMLSRVQANIMAIANNLFSSAAGYVKITPYQNNTAVDAGAWVMPVPNAIAKEPFRVLGVPNDEFPYEWIRALSLEVGTSEDTTGPWVPLVDQAEEIQQIDLELEVTGDSYDLVVQ